MRGKLILPTLLCAFLIGCGSGASNGSTTKSQTTCPLDANASSELSTIKRSIPASFGADYQKYFVKYTSISTPNGKGIHIFAQDKVSDEKMLRAKHILEFYLTDYKGSQYGSNKNAIKDKMADNGATLILLNGTDDGTNEASEKINAQPLFANEIQVEGGPWYKTQDYFHRDASYEEILHLVHDTGIGVTGEKEFKGVLPIYAGKIKIAQTYALTKKIWEADDNDTLKEWTEENSLAQEYFASVVDAYYGLWGAWTGKTTSNMGSSMWGHYKPRDREEMKTEDKGGYAIMNNKFLHPYLTYNARIDATFTGTFSLKFDSTIPYSHHSRYLKNITLLGSNDTNVRVNELDNCIMGNSGNNAVIFSGSSDEYSIETKDGITTVKDNTQNRDGTNRLRYIEQLNFANKNVTIEK